MLQKSENTQIDPPLAAFACSTVSQLRTKTQLVRTGHKYGAEACRDDCVQA